MRDRGWNNVQLATALGIDKANVTRWLGGDVPPLPRVVQIARALGVDWPWLIGVTSDMQGALVVSEPRGTYGPEPKRADDHHLPRVAFTAAGSPIHDVLQDEATTWYAFRRGWVKHLAGGEKGLHDAERFVVVQVDKKHLGESMIPTIKPGAIVVVDRGARGHGLAERKDIVQGKIYLVNIEGGLTVKRVFLDDGVLVLVADNPDRERYPPTLVQLKGKELHKIIVGRVVWIGQEEV